MKREIKRKAVGTVLIVIVMAIVALASSRAQAQGYKRNYYRGSSGVVAAVTSGLGSRSFLIKSDIDYINNMKATQEGWESSFIVGGNGVRLRTGFGAFKTSMNDVNSIKQSSFSGVTNIYALDMMGKANKYFHPYIVTGIDVNSFTFTGTYVPAEPLILSNPNTPALMCTCQQVPGPADSSLPPPNPGDQQTQPSATDATSTSPQVNSAKMTTTQVVTGLGGEINFRKGGRFFSMFGEVRYGIPVGKTTQSAVLNNTEITKNMAVTFGIGFGIGR